MSSRSVKIYSEIILVIFTPFADTIGYIEFLFRIKKFVIAAEEGALRLDLCRKREIVRQTSITFLILRLEFYFWKSNILIKGMNN